MRLHFRTFLMSFIVCSVIMGGGYAVFNHFYAESMKDVSKNAPVEIGYETHSNDADKTELEKLIDKSSRVNILLFGTDGGRSDTIMVLSYDPENNVADLISVPRDTYNEASPFKHPALKKINAVLGFKENGGPSGLKKSVSRLLKIPIAYYVEVQYDGIRNIVDSVDGVSVDIPFDMNYDDNYCDPPLHIHFQAGKQTLDGQKSIEFLRWRKNNGHEGKGDLPRTERQQQFMKSLAAKCFSYKLPMVIKTAFQYVKTDMEMDKMLFFGASAAGFELDNLKAGRIPGLDKESKYGYYYSDQQGLEKMMLDMYSKTAPGKSTATTGQSSNSN